MNIPNTPAIQALFDHPGFWGVLKSFAPSSIFSGHPLTLVDQSDCDGIGRNRKRSGPREAQWENCMDAVDWWHGADRGDYSRQIRRDVTPEQIARSACELNLLSVAVGREMEAWAAKNKAEADGADADFEAQIARGNAVDDQRRRVADAQHRAALAANAEFPGRENKAARDARRIELRAQFLAP